MALTDKGRFIINGTEYKAKSIRPSFDSLASEDSGRTDDGVMHIYWIKNRLRKWEIELPPCTSAEAASVLNKVQGNTYYITIWDILSNSEVTVHVYTSNSSGDCYNDVLYNGLWQGVKFSAIELGD